MLKALLVDLDGAPVNTQAANIAAYKEALQRFDLTAYEEDLWRHVAD